MLSGSLRHNLFFTFLMLAPMPKALEASVPFADLENGTKVNGNKFLFSYAGYYFIS